MEQALPSPATVERDASSTTRVAIYETARDKHIVFTEGCWEGGAKPGMWDRGERYARHIINDLNHWVAAWIDWNAVLDIEGGPNHVGNFCDAQILVDRETGRVVYQTSYHYFGHFSRFIRLGAIRLGLSVPDVQPGLAALACRNPNGEIVVVLLNDADVALRTQLNLGATSAGMTLPAHSIRTVVIKDETALEELATK
jgi:glucosylceramidase